MRIKPGYTAVITGAASGIGRAAAQDLAEQGLRLALVDINAEGLEAARAALEHYGTRVSIHLCDVSDAEQVRDMVGEVIAAHGGANLLINSAGVSLAGPLVECSVEDLDWILRINVMGTIYTCRSLLPVLRQAAAAHIANLSSDFGLIGLPTKSAYCATKFAVRGFTEALRSELHGTRVGVTCVYPGPVDTGLVRGGRAWDAQKQASEVDFIAQRGIPASQAARAIRRGIERNAPRVLIGKETLLIDWITRLFPGLTQSLVARVKKRVAFL